MRVVVAGLAVLVALAGCKKTDRQTDTEKEDRLPDVGKDRWPTDVTVGKDSRTPKVKDGKTPSKPADFTHDFEALSEWCEQSVNEISKTNQANPIRGKELADSKRDYLRRELVGKTVHWRVKVNGIGQTGEVRVAAFHRVERELIDNGRRVKYYDYLLSVRLQQKTEWFGGEDQAYNPIYIIKNVPLPKLRELNIGEFVSITGTVTKIESVLSYSIDLDGAKIE